MRHAVDIWWEDMTHSKEIRRNIQFGLRSVENRYLRECFDAFKISCMQVSIGCFPRHACAHTRPLNIHIFGFGIMTMLSSKGRRIEYRRLLSCSYHFSLSFALPLVLCLTPSRPLSHSLSQGLRWNDLVRAQERKLTASAMDCWVDIYYDMDYKRRNIERLMRRYDLRALVSAFEG